MRKRRKTRKPGSRKRRPDWKRPTPVVKATPLEELTAEQLLASTGCWPERILVDVGVDLHGGRQVETCEGETYDDSVGVCYAPLETETCGFRIRAKPRRIGVREVARYANGSCRVCHGLGYHAVTRRTMVGRDEAGNKQMQDLRYEQSCSCADRRYKQEFPRTLIDSQLGEWIALEELVIERVGESA